MLINNKDWGGGGSCTFESARVLFGKFALSLASRLLPAGGRTFPTELHPLPPPMHISVYNIRTRHVIVQLGR